MRPHLDYGDIIYDKQNQESLHQKIERLQYNAALAITGAIKGTYQSKLYSNLGPESLKSRGWFRRLCTFYKIKTREVPQYLSGIILLTNHLYNTCTTEDVTTLYSRTDTLKYSFFQYAVLEWNKLKWNLQQYKTMLSFRNSLLKTG